MTIALFGGSGRTGKPFIEQAIARGHQLRALTRKPERLPATRGLTPVVGDLSDAAAVRRVIEGADAVVSLVGQTKGGRKDVQTVGTRHMVDAMRANKISRIISMTGGGVPYEKDEPKFVDKMFRGVMGLFFKDVIRDAVGHAEVLRSSGLDYTIVRAPRLVDEPPRDSYDVGYVGTTGSSKIARADVARFILDALRNDLHIGDEPFVSW